MRYLLLTGFGLLPATLLAQPDTPDRMPAVSRRLDSQQAWLRRPHLPDTVRVKLLFTISKTYLQTDLDSARAYAARAVGLARRTHFQWGLVRALNNLGAACYYQSDLPGAQQAFEAELRLARLPGDQLFVGHAYLGLGNVASDLEDIAQSRRYYEQARAAYAACRPRNVRGELLVLHNLANSYLPESDNAGATSRPDLLRARRLALQGLRLLSQPNSPQASHLQLLLGSAQQQLGQPDSAEANWQHVLRVSRTHPDLQLQSEAWLHLAELAREQHRLPLALARTEQATKLMRQVGELQVLGKALNLKAQLMTALHQPGAYDTLRRYTDLRDTLLRQASLAAVATAQARFAVAEQRARVRQLEQERRIEELQQAQRRLRTRVAVVAAVLALLLLLGAGLWQYRRRQQRHEAALRQQLAADLHDDVGGLLSRIALQTDLMQEGLGAPELQQAQLAEVAGNSRLAVRQLNDVVWSLDARNDSVPNLLDRLRDYAHEVLVPTGRDVRFVADDGLGSNPSLSAPLRRGLYLIYKEALHNILKYAPTDATVTVGLRRAADVLHFDVVNSGPPATLTRDSGHGLRNMRERAAVLGGTAEAGPEPGGGFAVRVRVPV
jgi:signal transduction histidine kinase